MYCTCVFFTCACVTYRHVQSQSYYMTNVMGFTLFYCTVFNENDIFYDVTMTTNDLNMS